MTRICLILMFAIACGGHKPATKPPPDPVTPPKPAEPAKVEPVTTCPDVKAIDCMPIVKEENVRFCEAKNRAWIQKNCPAIGFTD